ncbi:hypothetical protein H8K90_05825 [Winogradskyella echinorum]|uniref:Prophage protein n=1 Tax=Winogradskyella echinorum TaxID=538189 RepID=A0ABR6XZI2_9FLAO|nr:hypothetical protein [Winogradskyella echinorum]MBC3845888.1 hypothetical protein [Winogradskyella echinorum]MBC5750236.1 hypothetical protein [Winogradskyella echinorum]
MKSNTNKNLPCAIFGHNYIRSKTNIDYTVELTCTHCDVVVVTDDNGNFDTNTVTNTQLKDTLQKLYRLKQRTLKTKAS